MHDFPIGSSPDLGDLLGPVPVCTGPRPLPEHLVVQGARVARAINPANVVPMACVAQVAGSGGPVLNPAQVAMLNSKFWGSRGVRLTVSFMEPVPVDFQQHVLTHMNAWGPFGNVSFTLAPAGVTGHVRITVRGQWYWSYLGTDILVVAKDEPTMCLQDFQQGRSESEYRRVIRHETGHTLGLPHEHARPEIVALLDQARTITYFERTQGWSEQMVRSQILTPLDPADLTSLPADVQSIMAYQFPGSCTKSGQPLPGGADIDAEDGKFLGMMYPLASQPPPPAPGRPGAVNRVRGYISPAGAPGKLVVYLPNPAGGEIGYVLEQKFQPSQTNSNVLMFDGPGKRLA